MVERVPDKNEVLGPIPSTRTMTSGNIHPSTHIRGGTVSETAHIREYCTLHETAVGGKCLIMERVSLKRCILGEGVEINAGCYLEHVVLEDAVQIGPNCSLAGIWHPFDEHGVSKESTLQEIRIQKGALLGAGVIVLPGVMIGDGAVVGAGTIVTKDVSAHHICYGPPHAQTLMLISEYLAKKKVQ